MDSVDGDGRADLGHAVGNGSAALNIVQTATVLNTHDEVGPSIAVEGLLERHSVAAKRLDLELAAKLVDARRVVVVVAALSAQVAVGAARAAVVAIGSLGQTKVVAVDLAALALLVRVARRDGLPGTAADWVDGKGGASSRQGEEESLGKHCVKDGRGL